ncbi:hypothetical protein GOODEAATRI_002403 [Goodea atripinnis]|uniref:Conserved Oligomeric Golgi complex subunit 6 C-terminal domain-containing protein n=1 Tax=Goodea atripinnis TaxID=208336 RepID=A0ABV0N788_9TELE
MKATSHRLEVRAQVAQAFLAKFQLSNEEMATLRGARDAPVTEETCDISPVLTQAMEALQDRPVLYKYTLDEFGTARRCAVVRGFIDALTRGGPGGTPRPIEMHSHDPLRSIIGTSVASLLITIEEMHLLSKKMFFNSLSLHASRLMDKVELPPPDLGPTASLNQTLSLLREVLTSHDSSVVPLDARQADFAQVLSCILDPLLQLCTVSASNLGTADMATYMVNSLYVMKTTLALFEFTDKRLEMLEFQIEAHLDTLINEQASYVLTRTGLSYIYNCVQQHTAEQVQFDRYLSSPDTLVMPQLNFLLSAAIREQIFRQSTDLVCRAYGEVYSALTSPANAYKEPENLVPRSPQQVQTLLS